MQLTLRFAELPLHDDGLWEHLDEATREAVIESLARAIAKVVTDNDPIQREHDDE
jgi:hypothetical protein